MLSLQTGESDLVKKKLKKNSSPQSERRSPSLDELTGRDGGHISDTVGKNPPSGPNTPSFFSSSHFFHDVPSRCESAARPHLAFVSLYCLSR